MLPDTNRHLGADAVPEIGSCDGRPGWFSSVDLRILRWLGPEAAVFVDFRASEGAMSLSVGHPAGTITSLQFGS